MKENNKSLESWIWGAACSIRGAKDAPKYKDYILPLIFNKRLCDVFDDELNRIAKEVGSREKAFKLVEADWRKVKNKKEAMVRFYLPLRPENPDEPVWSVIRKLSDKIGERLTTYLREIAKENPLLSGIIDRVDFNATTHGQRDLADDRLSNLIERISEKPLGLSDVEPDIIGRSYEYLIRKFAEGSVSSAGEFYTPKEVGFLMARIMDSEPGMEIYDPCCGSAGLLIKCQLVLEEKMNLRSRKNYAPLKVYGQEYIPENWAMANMNMIIHDMEGQIEIGDTFKNPKFRKGNRLQTFDRVVTNPMWNQDWFIPKDYDNDELNRFPKDAGYPGNKADWGWMQHILASLKPQGYAVVVLDTGAMSRGSGTSRRDKEKDVRKWFVQNDLIEAVILLPQDLFYNTPNAGVIVILNKKKRHLGELLMINLSSLYERERPKNLLTDEAVKSAVSCYMNWKSTINLASIVETETVATNDFNLLPNRYVEREIASDWDIQTARELSLNLAVLKRSMLFNVFATYESQLRKNPELLKKARVKFTRRKLGEVLELSDLRLASLDEKQVPLLSLTKDDGLIIQDQRFTELAVVDDLSRYKVVRRGWVVYNPMVMWEGAIHALYDYDVGIISPAYEVWIPHGIDVRYLDFLLKTPRLLNEYSRLACGGVNRRRIVSVSDFKNIEVELPDDTSSTIVVDAMDKMVASVDEAVGIAVQTALKILCGD